MKAAERPANEQERLSSLFEYNILDTLPEQDFDDITKIASEICATPVALITFIDEDRQWFKSKRGLPDEVKSTTREVAFCSHAILQPEEIMVVPDAKNDERFADNPFVTGPENVNFYAGVPLLSDKGYPMGTLCVLDNKPREISAEQRQTLKILANQVMRLLELHRKNEELTKNRAQLKNANTELEKFADVVAKDIKSPLKNIMMLSEMMLKGYGNKIDADGQQMLSNIKYSAGRLEKLTNDVLSHSRKMYDIDEEKQHFSFSNLINELTVKHQWSDLTVIKINADDDNIYSYKSLIARILENLLENAILHNQKHTKKIDVGLTHDKWHYTITVTDNGDGIAFEQLRKIFDLFYVGRETTNSHSGLGLATVKELTEKLGGKIQVSSDEGNGSTFTFTVHR